MYCNLAFQRCGNPVFQPSSPKDSANPHYQSRFRFRSSIYPSSPPYSMAQFSLDQKIFNFPTFGGTKNTWPTEQKTPKINHHSVSHLLQSSGSPLPHPSGNATLSHQHSSCQLSPLETATFGILSHHVTFTPLFLSLPSFWKMNHCTLPASQLFCAALFPALTIIKGPLHVVAVPHGCTPIFQTNSCLVFITLSSIFFQSTTLILPYLATLLSIQNSVFI